MKRIALILSSVVLVVSFHSQCQSAHADDSLRLTIVGVHHDADEQNPDWAFERKTDFDMADQVTLIAKIENQTNEEIAIPGIRYGNNVSKPWPGKSNQRIFGPQLFRFEITSLDGSSVPFPTINAPDQLERRLRSKPNLHRIAAGESILMLLRPFQWNSGVNANLKAGKYRLKLHMDFSMDEDFQHLVTSSDAIDFSISKPFSDIRHSLVWGRPHDGLRVAVEYRLADRRAENLDDFSQRIYPINSRIDVRMYFQNITKDDIEFQSETWRQDDRVYLVENEKRKALPVVWHSGIALQRTWTIPPKQMVVVDCADFSVVHPNSGLKGAIKTEPGDIRLVHVINDSLESGEAILTFRERQPADEPPTFPAEFQFETSNKQFAESGKVKIWSQIHERQVFFDGEFSDGVVALTNWTGEPVRLDTQIPGFEATTYWDVMPVAGKATIQLAKANPVTMRLISSDGTPIANAKVREFVATSETSSNYPYPSKGTEGTILATSNENGEVELSSVKALRDGKPLIHTFFIEPTNGYVGQFIGPLKAGTQVGDVEVSKPIEVSGIIKGTQRQLRDFAAAWDQPTPLILGNGKVSSQWGVSTKLQAVPGRDQLKFTIKNLRPGKLRIIANFSPHPHTVSSTFGLRSVGPKDQLFEFELTESRNDLVLEAGDAQQK